MGLRKLFKERSNKSGPDEDGELKKSMRLEESLQEIQGRYRKLLSHAQAITYTHDLQGQFLSVDQEITEFLGYDRNSLLNMNIRTILSSEVRHKFETYLDEIKRQGVSKGLMAVQTAAGEKRMLKYYNTLRTEAVTIPFVQGIAYDVTEQKQTKKALKELSEQLSIILKSLPIVCYIAKAEEDYGATYITHNVKAITGFEQTDFTSKSSFWANRVHPEDAPKIFADLPQIFEKGYHEHQYRWQVADGSYKWFYDYTRLIKSSDGKNYITGMMQDITERKRAEEALLNAAQQWRTTFDGINDFVAMLDREGKILRCNKAMKDFVGKPFSDILNRPYWEIIYGTAAPMKECPFLRMRENRCRETVILPIGDRWFNIVVDPLLDETCGLVGAVHTMSDITERRRAEESVARLSQENAVMAEIGRIVSSTLNIEEVYERFAEEVRKLISFDRIIINIINLKDNTTRVAYATGIDVENRRVGDIFSLVGSVTEECIRKKSSLLFQPESIEEGGNKFPLFLTTLKAGLRSMIFVSLVSEDQVIGVLSLQSTKPNAYTESDLKLAERVSNQIAGAIANVQLFIERKRMEDSLRESEVKFKDLFDHAPLGYQEYDIEGRITNVNRTDLEMLGYTAEEMIGQPVWKFNVQGLREQVLGKLAGTLPPGRNLERTYRRKDGSMLPVLIEDRLILDEKGQIKGIRCAIQDITERKRVEEALQRSEEGARRLSQENAVMAEIGRIISSTLNIEEVYERFAEEVRKLIPFDRIGIQTVNPKDNTTTLDYTSGVDVEKRRSGDVISLEGTAVAECVRTRSSFLFQTENLDEMLKRFPALLPAFKAGLRSMMCVPLISKDEAIGVFHLRSLKPNAYTESDLKLAERVGNQIAGAIANAQLYIERKRAEEDVRRNEEKLQALMDASPMAISWADMNGTVEYNNRKFRELFGYTVEDIPTIAEWRRLAYPDPAYRETVPSLVVMLTEAQKQGRGVTPIELIITCKDGSTRYVEQMGGFASNRILAIYKDITERKRAEEAVKRLAQENSVMAEIGRVISSTLNIDEVYERFAEEVRKLISFDRIGIQTVNTKDNTTTLNYISGVDVEKRHPGDIISLEGTAAGECVRTRSGRLFRLENMDEVEKRYPGLLPTFKAGLRSILVVPLISKDEIIGVLHLRSLKVNAYTETDLKLAERVSNQVAGAIANAQLFTERKRAEEAAARLAQENSVMAEIGRVISSTLNIDEVYERFAEEVLKLIPIDRISLSSNNPDGRSATMTYVWGPEIKNRKRGDVFPLKGTMVEKVMARRSGVLMLMENEEALVQIYPTLLNTFQAGFRSLISAPLVSEDQAIGVLNFHSFKEKAFTDLDVKLAERVGNQIAGAIANAQLFTERKRAEEAAARLAQENSVMAEIGRVISSTLNIEEVYERFAEEVRKLIPFDRIAVTRINFKDRSGSVAYAWGVEVPHRKQGEVYPIKGLFYEELITTRAGILVQAEDEKELAEHYPGLQGIIHAGFQSMISVPLISKDEVMGIFHLRSFKSNAYTESDLKLAERVGNQIAGAIANAKLYAERKQMEKALRESEERFRELYDHAPLGYHEYDAEGIVTNVNRTDLEMLGYTADEMIGQPMWKFNVGEDSVREQILAKLAGVAPPGRNLERTYWRKDGTTIPVLVEDRLILGEKGQIKGIRSTIQDITERKLAEEERSLLQEQLRQSQKMEAIGKLAGGVAHDFNNLLTVIHGYSELLLNSLEQGSRFRQDVQEIINASDRASSLTRQLLAFSRKQVLQPQVLDLNADVSNMDKMLRRMIGEDIELVTLLAKDLGRVKADPGQIEQVILNLAVNAKDAMRSGGKLTIETANVKLDENYARTRISVTPGNYVMLSMSDTGVGMTPETKERIFEPFFTTKEKGKGTGLGLSTVYGIIQQSGGNIWVYSEPGLGTTFKIYLPTMEGETESLRPAAVSTKPMQGFETILLVEDEEMVRKLACTVLQKNGYRVLEASNGDNALDVVEGRNGNPIHLVLTDVVMPGMSGRQLADRLMSLQPELKVLYMSGYTDNAIVHHGVLDPGIAYIQKPFTPDALASKVRKILDGN